MVKTVKEKVQEVIEGKKQHLIIAFNDNMELKFEDILGYQLNGDWVAVMTKEGSTLAYPQRDVKMINHFSE